MPIYRALGSKLYTEAAFREKVADRSFARSMAAAPPTEFFPVGPGKPLTVMIRNVYTGRYPKGAFGGAKDMLVVSAMKGIEVYNAAPRAVNFLKKDVRRNASVALPAATDEGTPLVFYAPALTQADSILTIEVVFDEFPKDAFDKAASVFTGLGGIPAFAPASGVLFGAGILTRLIGRLGEALVDGQPVMRATEGLTFTLPGALPPVADFRLLTDEELDRSMLTGYELRGDRLMKVGTNEEYTGDVPYVVISLDGRKNNAFEGFVPRAATAAILERFYRSQGAGVTVLDGLVDAVKLYNDAQFRRKAESLRKEIGGLPDGPEKEARIDEFNALARNILSDELKLEELP